MIVCPEPRLPDGALLRLRLPGLTAIDGSVIWQHKGFAGVRFLAPLHDAVLVYLGLRAPMDSLAEAAAHDAQGEVQGNRCVRRGWLADPSEVRVANG